MARYKKNKDGHLLKPLELTDIVQTLRYYDVKHQEFPKNDEGYFGITDFEKKKIYLNVQSSIPDLDDTVIHELAHAYWETKGVELSEKDTIHVTNLTMKKYYDPKYKGYKK